MKALFWSALCLGALCALFIYLHEVEGMKEYYIGSIVTGCVFIFECGLYLHLDNKMQQDWVEENRKFLEKQ